MHHLYSGETASAVAMARRALAFDPRDENAYRVLDSVSMARNEPAEVIAAVRGNFPDLAGPEALRIIRASLLPATDLGLALHSTGDVAAAEELLDAVTRFLDAARAGGTTEFAIYEIRVAAIRGDHEGALRALLALIAGGWRGAYWRCYRDHDPAFAPLRADPRFQEAFAVVERDVRVRRERAAASGDLARPPP